MALRQWLVARVIIISLNRARANNNSLRLLFIDVRLLIKYNAFKNNVIVILIPSESLQIP